MERRIPLGLAVRAPWWDHAACRGVDLGIFYSPDSTGQALAICARCAVRDQCLADALSHEARSPYAFGISGGLTARERRKLRTAGRDTVAAGALAAVGSQGR